MTFRVGPDDPRRKLAESEVMKILTDLQDTGGFGDVVQTEPVPERTAGIPSAPISCPDGSIILADYRTDRMTVAEVARMIGDYQADPAYCGYDIFLDGDRQAIVARPKVVSVDNDGPLIGRLRLP